MKSPSELVERVEAYLDELALTPELGQLAEPMRYALAGGGKRIRPVLTLATGEARSRRQEEPREQGDEHQLDPVILPNDCPANVAADAVRKFFHLCRVHRMMSFFH